ncbi:MAG: bifunctional oligoribonuclease/PAP phosphatase NrnA [Anaerolineae bacterium]|nr:bifunctional oligoribonuclease/PAP phosphatase NrnA [Anaerolineae bacterium]
MRIDWDEAGALVDGAQNIVIVTHVGPDGDAIGSMLGLARALRSLGKKVITAVDGGVPEPLAFLPGAQDVRSTLNGVAPDLTIAVDCGDESRMGQVGREALQSGAPLINLDHHRTNTLFGQANLVDLDTVAAAEGVLDWLDRLGIQIDPVTAFCLLTGIVTDTLCFRVETVTADTLAKAQRLMACGASLPEIVQRTVNRTPYAGVRLWSKVMPTVHLEEHVIWAVITQAMFAEADYVDGDDAGLVSFLVQADEAYISVVFKEKDDGAVEIGMRAVPGFDTASVAVVLGGGGHRAASGATVDEPLDTLVPRVVEMLKAEVRKGQPLVK